MAVTFPYDHTADISYDLIVSAGSNEDAWFDSVAVFESDCDEDYQSVQSGILWRSLIQSICIHLFPVLPIN